MCQDVGQKKIRAGEAKGHYKKVVKGWDKDNEQAFVMMSRHHKVKKHG